MQTELTRGIIGQQVLEKMPQRKPFRFLDEILEISDSAILGKYTFKPDEFFYTGHFPGNPVTPGVILLETMAQTGVVALGIYLAMKANSFHPEIVTFFTEAEVEFLAPVLPGTTVRIRGEKIFFRHGKLRSRVEILLEDQTIVAAGILSGMGVRRS